MLSAQEGAIRHIVMWRVRGSTDAERQEASEQIKRAFEGLRGRIPGMSRIEVGVDISRIDYACDLVLVADFESLKALQDYAEDKEHLRVKREIEGIRIARHQVDFAIG